MGKTYKANDKYGVTEKREKGKKARHNTKEGREINIENWDSTRVYKKADKIDKEITDKTRTMGIAWLVRELKKGTGEHIKGLLAIAEESLQNIRDNPTEENKEYGHSICLDILHYIERGDTELVELRNFLTYRRKSKQTVYKANKMISGDMTKSLEDLKNYKYHIKTKEIKRYLGIKVVY